MEWLIGAIIGLVLGLTGAGGSVFAVPLLVMLTPMPPAQAMGVALGTVAATAVYATLSRIAGPGRSMVLWAPAAILALSGALTAPAGKWLATLLDPSWLMTGFTLVAIAIAARMWLQAQQHPEDTRAVRAAVDEETAEQPLSCRLSPNGQFQLRPRCVSGMMLGGLVIGFASGLFGVGGGFLIVPLLLYLSQIRMQVAVATSLAVIALVSGSGFASHLVLEGSNGFDWPGFTRITVASLAAMFITQRISRAIAGPTLQKIFAAALIAVSLITLVR